MGFSGISVPSLLIILVIVLVLFGGKRLRSLGTDLGGAIKGFRSAVKEQDEASAESARQAAIEQNEASDSPAPEPKQGSPRDDRQS